MPLHADEVAQTLADEAWRARNDKKPTEHAVFGDDAGTEAQFQSDDAVKGSALPEAWLTEASHPPAAAVPATAL